MSTDAGYLSRTAGLLHECLRDVIRTHQPEIERVLAGEPLDPQAPPELVARAIQAQGMWFQLLSIAEQNAAMRQRRQREVERGHDQLRGTFAQVVSA
ncbi:MAG: phosphoenolpyruvate carboxylase, partial [Gemmatimonadetes bacterium]